MFVVPVMTASAAGLVIDAVGTAESGVEAVLPAATAMSLLISVALNTRP
jgi:hypothetical protein